MRWRFIRVTIIRFCDACVGASERRHGSGSVEDGRQRAGPTGDMDINLFRVVRRVKANCYNIFRVLEELKRYFLACGLVTSAAMCVQWHALACLPLPAAAAAAARLTTLYRTLHVSHHPRCRPPSLARLRRHHTLCSAVFHFTVMHLQLLQARLPRCNILPLSLLCRTKYLNLACCCSSASFNDCCARAPA